MNIQAASHRSKVLRSRREKPTVHPWTWMGPLTVLPRSKEENCEEEIPIVTTKQPQMGRKGDKTM